MIIFYSWQSDLPHNSNKLFIQECLEESARQLNTETDIQLAERENNNDSSEQPAQNQQVAVKQSKVEIDHDTKNVLGIPAIADTILRKIDDCDLFVADVSFTGKGTFNNKCFPNPNVMLELGYAMAKLGDERIILTMDTAHGKASELPFDLRHRRWPITFSSNNQNPEQEKQKLVDSLVDAFTPYLNVVINKQKLELSWFVDARPNETFHIIFELSNVSDTAAKNQAVRFYSSETFNTGALMPIEKHTAMQPYIFTPESPYGKTTLAKSNTNNNVLLMHTNNPVARWDTGWTFGRPFKEFSFEYEVLCEDFHKKGSLLITQDMFFQKGRISP